MTLKVSGILSRPVSGETVPNARITFDAVSTGTVVLKGVSSVCKTAADGSYSVDLEYGDYTIQISWSGQTQQYGVVHIDDTTPMGDLNELLLQQIMEQQVTPEIILEFRQLEQEIQEDLAQVEALEAQAAASATSAATSATSAQASADSIAGDTDAAAASAAAALVSENNASASATSADSSKQAASVSEVNAATSEDNAAISERNAATSASNASISAGEASTSQTAASVSEVNSSTNAGAAGTSATAASSSASKAATSEQNSKTSETNAENARDAAEEYAQEAKDAASKVTDPIVDCGTWSIQSGYPDKPTTASIWQVIDGGVDPVNAEIIWDAGDMLLYLASSSNWCRILGQQVVAGEPQPIKFDSDIVLNGASLQFITTGTTTVDGIGLDASNNLVLGDATTPNVCILASDPKNVFVMVPAGDGKSFTLSHMYSEAYPPPTPDTSGLVPQTRTINGKALNADITLAASDVGAVPTTGGDVGYLNNAAHYAIVAGTWEGAGGFADQYTNPAAPFLLPGGYSAPSGGSSYLPLIKGIAQTQDYGFAAAISFGVLVSGIGDFPRAAIHVIGDSGTGAVWSFDPNSGTFSCPGLLYGAAGLQIIGGDNVTSGANVVASHAAGDASGGAYFIQDAAGNNIASISADMGGNVFINALLSSPSLHFNGGFYSAYLDSSGDIDVAGVIREQGQRLFGPNNPQPIPQDTAGGVNSYVIATFWDALAWGALVDGASLSPASVRAANNYSDDAVGLYGSGSLAGTWMLMGAMTQAGSGDYTNLSLFMRVA